MIFSFFSATRSFRVGATLAPLAVATLAVASLATFAACNSAPPRAAVLTAASVAKLGLSGDAVDARAGDYVMRSTRLVAVVQRPLRDAGPAPYGGNLIDVALTGDGINRFGEAQPFLNMGRTANFDEVDIVADGSDGGPVVVEATGSDALWDFVNIPAVAPTILTYRPDGTGLLQWDCNAPIGAKLKARYALGPDDDFVSITYTVSNPTNAPMPLLAGSAFDTGGALSFFQHGAGYGSVSSFDPSIITKIGKTADFFALVGDDVAYGLRMKNGPLSTAIGLNAAGVAVMVPGKGDVFTTVLQPNLVVPANASKSYTLEVQAGRTLSAVRARFLARDGAVQGEVAGQLAGDPGLFGGPGAASQLSLALLDMAGEVEATTFVASNGSFYFNAPPGNYTVLLDAPGYGDISAPAFAINAGETTEVTLALPTPATLAVEASFFDRSDEPTPTPAQACRIAVFSGTPLSTRSNATAREFNASATLERVLQHCSSQMDGPILLPPGTYMVQTSAGPLRDFSRTRVTLAAGQSLSLTPALHRTVVTSDAAGAAIAADFHQHSVNSPDSIVPLYDRVLSYAAEDIAFFASSNHDRLTDYAPLIADLGLEGALHQAIGVETTTFPFGHFNAWPLPFDPTLPSGGAIDWARETATLLPRDIFRAFRERGAAIVQVNHSRARSANDFQNFFDRAGLTVDPDRGILGSDPLLQTVPNELLRLPAGEPLFDDGFDALEILNGFNFGDEDGDGRPDDIKANAIMRDWLGFLAMGFRPTVVGVSDSHTTYRSTIGYPRTYVWLDNGAAINPENVQAALKQGRAVATNGPFMRVGMIDRSFEQIGVGGLAATDDDGNATLRVEVQALTKSAIDRVDVFVNDWVRTPGRKGMDGLPVPEPLTPALSLPVTLEPVPRGNGGVVYTALVVVPITVVVDAFVVVRASGVTPMFPFLPGEGFGKPNASANGADDFFAEVQGSPALAISNPIFLDRDQNGRYDSPRVRVK